MLTLIVTDGYPTEIPYLARDSSALSFGWWVLVGGWLVGGGGLHDGEQEWKPVVGDKGFILSNRGR